MRAQERRKALQTKLIVMLWQALASVAAAAPDEPAGGADPRIKVRRGIP
jgi:hypothetical protein